MGTALADASYAAAAAAGFATFASVLQKVSGPLGLVGGVFLLWLAWRTTSPPSELLRDRRDPYQALGVNRVSLASPSESWVWAP